MGLRQMILYFMPYRKPIARFPRRIAPREDDVRLATNDEITLMYRGLARTRTEARRLMRRHNATHAQDVIDATPRRRFATFRTRLRHLLMRIEGSTDLDPLTEKHARVAIP